MLRDAGVAFTATEAGGYRLLGRLQAPPLAGRIAQAGSIRLTAMPVHGNPPAAMDGRAETRWSTGVPQAPGQWLTIELDAPIELAGLELELGGAAFEYPRGLAVRIDRGDGWADVAATVRWVGPLVWVGTHVLRAGVERVLVTFPAARVRGLRLVQTGSDAVYPWSVAELRLRPP
jgi:hypothetical protein